MISIKQIELPTSTNTELSVADYLKKSIKNNMKEYEISTQMCDYKSVQAFYFNRVLDAIGNYELYCLRGKPPISDDIYFGTIDNTFHLTIKNGVIEENDQYRRFLVLKDKHKKHNKAKVKRRMTDVIRTRCAMKIFNCAHDAFVELLWLIGPNREITEKSIINTVKRTNESDRPNITKFINAVLEYRFEAMFLTDLSTYTLVIELDNFYTFSIIMCGAICKYALTNTKADEDIICREDNTLLVHEDIMTGSSDALYGRTLFSR